MQVLHKRMFLLIGSFKCIAFASIAYLIFISVFTFIHEYISFFTSKLIGNGLGLVMAAVCIEIAGRFHKQERAIALDDKECGENIAIINKIHIWYNLLLFPKYIELCKDKAIGRYGVLFVMLWCFATALIPISIFFVGVWFRLWEVRMIPFGLTVIVAFSAMEAIRWEATIRGDFRRKQ